MLTLPIKQKWFDMIASGEKKEEYRLTTQFYYSRLMGPKRFLIDGKYQFYVKLRAGYRKDSPTMVIRCWLDVGRGKEEWGAEPGEEYFRLHITWKGDVPEEDCAE